jgi:hypothetical protein
MISNSINEKAMLLLLRLFMLLGLVSPLGTRLQPRNLSATLLFAHSHLHCTIPALWSVQAGRALSNAQTCFQNVEESFPHLRQAGASIHASENALRFVLQARHAATSLGICAFSSLVSSHASHC